MPACREHAVEALEQPATRIVIAYQPDVALSVFADAHGEGSESTRRLERWARTFVPHPPEERQIHYVISGALSTAVWRS